jgi:hypothetical protein
VCYEFEKDTEVPECCTATRYKCACPSGVSHVFTISLQYCAGPVIGPLVVKTTHTLKGRPFVGNVSKGEVLESYKCAVARL